MARRRRSRRLRRPLIRYGGSDFMYRTPRLAKSSLRSLVKLTNTKLSRIFQLSTDGSGFIIGNYAIRDPVASNEWSAFTTLYDSYRVNAIKLKFIPHVPAGNSVTVDYQALFICMDPDNSAGTPTFSKPFMIDYDNHRVKSLFRPWKVFYKVPRWFTGLAKGFNDTGGPPDEGRLYMYSENAQASQLFGDVVMTYYVTFKNRR